MKKKLVIVGTGSFAEVVFAYFEEFSDYEVVAFACDPEFKKADVYLGLPLHLIDELPSRFPSSDFAVFVAVGYRKMNKIRQRLFESMKEKGYECATFVHPDVKVWNSTQLGENVFIFEDNTIQPFSVIGDNTTLWSGNHVGHHAKIGCHAFISSHVVISGACEVGDNVFIGVNATLRDGIKVADETLIGAGSLIMQDTAPRSVYMPEGTEARRITSNRLGF
ncbi:acetyltransferase [Herbaspirillum sp. WKF16]|uniref:acetyltransferase n=1 Tax=Herbaspirillum sp. WKF16 TaxID=3028312 RepID=UPI0023A9E025|nr:acetyltransferase [Herbaspirillum sp. WKF16]WDZ96596.1 acetyltransferase [Herbaspirillum sp. WKF16]